MKLNWNFQGEGAAKQKTFHGGSIIISWWWGGGSMDIFWNNTISGTFCEVGFIIKDDDYC